MGELEYPFGIQKAGKTPTPHTNGFSFAEADYMVVGTGRYDKNGNSLSASVEISVDGQEFTSIEDFPYAIFGSTYCKVGSHNLIFGGVNSGNKVIRFDEKIVWGVIVYSWTTIGRMLTYRDYGPSVIYNNYENSLTIIGGGADNIEKWTNLTDDFTSVIKKSSSLSLGTTHHFANADFLSTTACTSPP